jgi:molybdopterin-guanine dinucleotide biosynthesis protein B
MIPNKPPIVSIVGYSGSGKTTFMEKLIPTLSKYGLNVATVKHDVHGFEMDKPGKDTWRHKKAGAVATIISSTSKIGLVMDSDHDHDPQELIRFFPKVDIVLTEGYKKGPHPKLEIFRPSDAENKIPLCVDDAALLAIVSDRKVSRSIPCFGLDDFEGVAQYLIKHFKLGKGDK